MSSLPFSDLKVVDFSTYLPGPLATLFLSRMGAEVIRIERPPHGDPMRSQEPKFGPAAANYALVNSGKSLITADLTTPKDRSRVMQLVQRADVLVEQYRPGVMSRLGFGYDDVAKHNPRLVYCSITAFGQTGRESSRAAHDLNCVAESGLLSQNVGPDGTPVLPPALIADIGGGAYPALVNIMAGLRDRDRTGRGMHIDISMMDGLFVWLYWALASGFTRGDFPSPGAALITGGSPRYNIYRTRDDRFIAVAALEDRFWIRLCALVELGDDEAYDRIPGTEIERRLAERFAARRADEWEALFRGEDVCCSVVRSLSEAVGNRQFRDRELFERKILKDGLEMPALYLPIDSAFVKAGDETYLDVGSDDGE